MVAAQGRWSLQNGREGRKDKLFCGFYFANKIWRNYYWNYLLSQINNSKLVSHPNRV